MVTKFMSLVMAMIVGELLIFGVQSPQDSIFLIFSNNQVVVIVRLLLTAAMIVVAFRARFVNKVTRGLSAAAGGFLIMIGVLGILSNTVGYALSDYVKALDFVFMIEMGIIFSVAALDKTAGKRKLSMERTVYRRLPVLKLLATRLSHS